EKGANGGVTCFLVDRDAGWKSEYIDTMGEWGEPPHSEDETRGGLVWPRDGQAPHPQRARRPLRLA
ncbi:hypothetical protein ABTX61_39925, partial [Amycolatopsis japonica]